MTREFTVRAGGDVAPDGGAAQDAADTTDEDADDAEVAGDAADRHAQLDALEERLREAEQDVFGAVAVAADVWAALDAEQKLPVMEQRIERVAEAMDADGAADAGGGAANAAHAGAAQSGPPETGGDPSGYGSDMFTDGGARERPPTVLAALDAEDAAEDPLNGETLPGVFATLEARRRAEDPLSDAPYPGVFATLAARERAAQDEERVRDRRAGAIDVAADPEQGYTGSYRTGANYAGSATGQDHARPQPDGYSTGGVFARLRAEEQDA